MEMFVVTAGYDYEGEDVIGVFSDEASARACYQEEVEDEEYDFVEVRAYQGRHFHRVAFLRLSDYEE